MFKKLLFFGVASLMLLSGWTFAAPAKQIFEVEITGDITADVSTGEIKPTRNQSRVNFQDGPPMSVEFNLGIFWQFPNPDYTTQPGGGGSECFPVGPVSGAIYTAETKGGDAEAVFWFIAGATTDILYMLTLTDFDESWDATFPPRSVPPPR